MGRFLSYETFVKKLNDGKGYRGYLTKKDGTVLVFTNNHACQELAICELNKKIKSYNQRYNMKAPTMPQQTLSELVQSEDV